MTLPRRLALAAAAASLLTAADAPPPSSGPGLNQRAQRSGRFYGSAINSRMLVDDPAYMACVAHECGAVVGETAFKWGPLRPHPGLYAFTEADQLMAFAERHGMLVRGHTLLWHGDNPAWLKDTLTPANAEGLLRSHIQTVAGHCRHRVAQWDVVNEVIDPADNKPFGLRDTLWTRALGPDCIDIAFESCAEAAPEALLCLNEYGLDYDLPAEDAKRQATLAVLAQLLGRGVKLQALGMQAHLDAAVGALNQAKLAQFCNDVAGLGLKIVITEFDVRDNRLPADPALRDAAVAAHARAYLDAVLSCPAVLGVMSWGLSDRRSWLNDELPRADKLPQRPLPLDAGLQRKPLWQAMAAAFAAAPGVSR